MLTKQKKGTYCDFTSSAEIISGNLSFKRIIHKKNSFVQTWCTLKNRILSIFKKKDMKHLEDISIEVSRIISINKNRSKYFSFQISNSWNKYIFVCKNENEYREWMKRLKFIESSINTKSNVNQSSHVLKLFYRDECISWVNKTDKFDLKLQNQNEFIKECGQIKSNKTQINNRSTNPPRIRSSSVTFDPYSFIDENDTNTCNTKKFQTMTNSEISNQNSSISKNDIGYDSDFPDEICKGYLWIKTMCDKEKMYVKFWCSLINKTLGVYEEKDGKHLQDINIEVSKISLLNKHRSNNFYFRIISNETEFTFGTRAGNEYGKWINKLQSIALNITSENKLM